MVLDGFLSEYDTGLVGVATPYVGTDSRYAPSYFQQDIAKACTAVGGRRVSTDGFCIPSGTQSIEVLNLEDRQTNWRSPPVLSPIDSCYSTTLSLER